MSTAEQSLAFERLVRPHFDRLYRLAWRLTGAKAEEPGSWLCRVMYNLFIDERRRFARQRMHTVDEGQLGGDGLEGLPGTENPVIDNERLERINELDKALAQLSDEHRIVVLLHDTEGHKLLKIAELTGVPVGTVKSRLHRARARLREILVANGTIS